MSDLEKINIYVPREIGLLLEKDAMLFEVFKKGGLSVNMNRFLNMIIKEYSEDFHEEYQILLGKVRESLESLEGDERGVSEVADDIVKNIIMPEIPKRKGKKPIRLSLKPVDATEDIIERIYRGEMGETDSISQFICRIFVNYCNKSITERERIIFKENYSFLEKAARKGRTISFFTKVGNVGKRQYHTVLPYALVTSREEMFNYLLCCEKKNGEMLASTYRLNRIINPDYSSQNLVMTEEVKGHLEQMKHYSPQFAINADEECCVFLTEQGLLNYSLIYTGRPDMDKDRKPEKTKGGYKCYFHASRFQLAIYFRRFGKDARILYPKGLREDVEAFHREAAESYKQNEDKTK